MLCSITTADLRVILFHVSATFKNILKHIWYAYWADGLHLIVGHRTRTSAVLSLLAVNGFSVFACLAFLFIAADRAGLLKSVGEVIGYDVSHLAVLLLGAPPIIAIVELMNYLLFIRGLDIDKVIEEYPRLYGLLFVAPPFIVLILAEQFR